MICYISLTMYYCYSFSRLIGNIVNTVYTVTLQMYNNANLTKQYNHISIIDYS